MARTKTPASNKTPAPRFRDTDAALAQGETREGGPSGFVLEPFKARFPIIKQYMGPPNKDPGNMWQDDGKGGHFIALGGLHFNIGNLTVHGKPPYEGEIVGLDDRHAAFEHPRFGMRAFTDRGLDYFFGNPDAQYDVRYPEVAPPRTRAESIADFIKTWAPREENRAQWPNYIRNTTNALKESFGTEWPTIDPEASIPLKHLLNGKFWDSWATAMAPNEMRSGWTTFNKEVMKTDYAKEASIALLGRLHRHAAWRTRVEAEKASDSELNAALIARGFYKADGTLMPLSGGGSPPPPSPERPDFIRGLGRSIVAGARKIFGS